ncbi:hypothetical protein NP493_194g01005 [Ridgeia piscesae]|uniref:Uncharacterized protein n=1 Tax=Ridgeia piscesae TaxID=27915 RepID=A0AAD9UEL8_RIDPI|nr:hypothetical protein NP493_194g01005 [Ridgeia piscesae]
MRKEQLRMLQNIITCLIHTSATNTSGVTRPELKARNNHAQQDTYSTRNTLITVTCAQRMFPSVYKAKHLSIELIYLFMPTMQLYRVSIAHF